MIERIGKWVRSNQFVVLMAAAVLLGLVLPGPGAATGTFSLKALTFWGVALIFFLHGANLAPKVFLNGVKRWRVHLVVQGTTYIAFPLLGAAIALTLGGVLPPDLLLGFIFLVALPSTISSAVALTAVAKGNVPVAVFNASASGLIGLVVTPALVALASSAGAARFDFLSAVIDIATTVLLPFVLGQLARPLIGGFLKRHKSVLGKVDRSVILLIIYTSFAASTAAGIWSGVAAAQILVTFALVAVILAAALGFVDRAAKLVGLPTDDRAAALFCGATKSLATGAPMAQILFADRPGVGVIMLPLLLYHPLQLTVCAVIAQRYAGASEEEERI